jgi:CubicO group peptidase (beta-lactamase class C family)
MKAIDELLSKGIEKGDFPGVQYAVVNDKGIVYSNYLGFKQLFPERQPCDGTEIYDCASLTKVICTTTMILKLIEDGKLALHQKIKDIFPEFKHEEVTIYHLLTHSSGLSADISKSYLLCNKAGVMEKVFCADLIYETGKRIVYSDIGFILLGFIIEAVTAMSLDNYARKIVFNPLQMTDSSYHPNPNRCAPTEYRDDNLYKGYLTGRVHDEKAFALGNEAGHAGLFSTTQDLAKFISSILRNDGTLLKKSSIDSLFITEKRDFSNDSIELIRTLGWNKPTKGGTMGDYFDFENSILHTGFTGCNLWIDKSRNLGFVMLSNAVHPKRSMNRIIGYRKHIANLLINAKEKFYD